MAQPRNFSTFLYRRLARWITCEVKLLGKHPLALDNKFQVNSVQDVFCHPFYWQLYGWLRTAPELVVDLGAHCGHFSMLADLCFRIQFVTSQPEYISVEPNPNLLKVLSSNFKRSGLCSRHTIHQGLVGAKRSGAENLWVCSSNYLSASVQPGAGTYAIQVDYLDLEAIAADRRIDLLKIDIEGAEYGFVTEYQALLRRVERVMIEVHENANQGFDSIYAGFAAAGLQLKGPPLCHGSAQLAMLQRT